MRIVSTLAKGYMLIEPIFSFQLFGCCKWLDLFHRLAEQRCAEIVSEHKMDVSADGDCLVELDPTGGSMLLDWKVRGLEQKGNIPTNTRLQAKSSNLTQI